MAGVPRNEYRFVIIGKTGAGKSATANMLIGNENFKALLSAGSVTSECSKASGKLKGKEIVVVDTPGLFDTALSQEKVTTEIMRCVGISSPGPHAVIMVIKIGRITPEEIKTVDHIIEQFGKAVMQYLIVIFTRMDDIIEDGTTLDEYLSTAPLALKNVLEKCGGYIGFNNRAKGVAKMKQLNAFYDMVTKIVKNNGNTFYSNEMYKEVEANIMKRIKSRESELEEQQNDIIRKIQEDFRKKFEESEKKNMELRIRAEKAESFKKEIEHLRHGYETQRKLTEAKMSELQINTNLEMRTMKQKMETERQREIQLVKQQFQDKMDEQHLRNEEREDIVKGKSGIFKMVKSGVTNLLQSFKRLVR